MQAPEEGSLIFPPPPSSTHQGRALHAAAGAPAARPAPRPPAPSPGGKKIGGGQWEATKALDVREPAGGVAWRPRRGQRSVPSPGTPVPLLPRSRALYRARACGQRSSSSPRAVVGSARGGGPGTPGRGGALFASLFFFPPTPHSRAPSSQSTLLSSPSCLVPRQTFGPSPAGHPLFVVARARPCRPEGSSGPPCLQLRPLQDPEICRPHFCPPSTISTSCVRYAREPGGRKEGRQEAPRVFRLCLCPPLLGHSSPP